ncbi:MAG: hypothetical protein KC777_12625 [Cyanobacteria bacterium HKST-UBA02]|nr:hypothetical protein [Cyanobacteria bacterium HKST-UBA02]
MALSNALAASAQLEPRLAGDWQAGDRTWHLEQSGRYKCIQGGSIVETGKITALDRNFNLRSDSGRTASGSFSVIGGDLKFHGGDLGSWSRATSAPVVYKDVSNYSHAPNYSHTPSYSPPASAAPPVVPVTSSPVTPPPSNMTYSHTFGHQGENSLPGYTPAAAPAPAAAAQTPVAAPVQSRAASVVDKVKQFTGQYAGGKNGDTFAKWDAVQKINRPATPGWRPNPRGGYIPVMKDGKARSFWRGY